jgi:hypothetical protein
MSGRDDTAEFQDRVLRELTELGLEFARELKAQVHRVKSVDDADRLTLAFHRATRTARLAMALQTKLARERLQLKKLARSETAQLAKARKAQIRTVICNQVYTPEAAQDWADAMRERLDERLDEEALFESFLEGPVDQHIARLQSRLGLPAAPAPATTAEAPAPAPAPDAERSEPPSAQAPSPPPDAPPEPP